MPKALATQIVELHAFQEQLTTIHEAICTKKQTFLYPTFIS